MKETKPKEKNTKVKIVLLENKDYKILKKASKKRKVSMSKIINELIKDYLRGRGVEV